MKALRLPAEREHVKFQAGAIDVILGQTRCYPYFLQEWGKHSWNVAEASPISASDAQRAAELALPELDASFFRVRFDRLTPSEKRYLRAMAELGSDRAGHIHRSGGTAQAACLRAKSPAVRATAGLARRFPRQFTFFSRRKGTA